MRKLFFMLVLLFAVQAWAGDAVRCGTDDFGNTVCMDKNGVSTITPKKAVEKPESEKAAPAAKDESGMRTRCGVDQFGNTVCSQFPEQPRR